MNISISFTTPADDPLLNGFAKATGWTQETGRSKKQWVLDKVKEWTRRTAISGRTLDAASVVAGQTALQTAVKTARVAAAAAIPLPSGNLGS